MRCGQVLPRLALALLTVLLGPGGVHAAGATAAVEMPAAVEIRELGRVRLPLTGMMPATIVATGGGRAYIAGTACPAGHVPASPECEGALIVMDAAGDQPILLGQYHTGGEWLPAVDLAIHGPYAYVVLERRTPDTNDGFELRILDVSDPARITVVGGGGLPVAGGHYDLAIGGGHLYWSAWFGRTGADGPAEVRVYDLTQPTAPAAVGHVPLPMGRMVIDAGRLVGTVAWNQFTGSGPGLAVFDVRDPTQPIPLGDDAAEQATRRRRYLDLAVTVDRTFLLEQGRLQCPSGDPRYTIDCGNGLTEVDVGDATNPHLVWEGMPGQVAGPLQILGDLLTVFAATPEGRSALAALDISRSDRGVVAMLQLDEWAGEGSRYGRPIHFAATGDRVLVLVGVGFDLGDVELRVARVRRVARVFLPWTLAR